MEVEGGISVVPVIGGGGDGESGAPCWEVELLGETAGATWSGLEVEAGSVGEEGGGFYPGVVVIGTVVFGLVYGWLFRLFGSAGWVTGGVTGLVHGVVVGLVMPMPSIHPRVSREPAAVGAPAVQIEDGEVEVSNLGVFGVNWGRMTPVGLVVAHVVYGIVLALVYTALV